MDVLDLFSGAVGGWSLGLHRAGFRTVAACEVDPWRRAVYGVNFPAAKLYRDVRELTAGRLISDLGYLPDIIAGSPPCQDASAANTKGKRIDGPETGLFLEAVRLVREVRPAWALFENSPRLRTRGIDRVLDELDSAGYACWPLVVAASDLGVPHERKRMWLIAADTDQRRQQIVAWGEGRERAYEAPSRPGPAGRSEIATDAIRDRIWIESGWREWKDRSDSAIAADDPYANPCAVRVGASAAPDDGCRIAGQRASEGDIGYADRDWQSGNAVGDALAQFQALERAIGPAVHSWNGGAARSLRMAHGLAPRLARIRVSDHKHPGHTINAAKACISAQGDAILPQIAEAIGRAILAAEAASLKAAGVTRCQDPAHAERQS